nr:hypothetical protein JVH1_0495 [Rhodococcus sp. JVH1]
MGAVAVVDDRAVDDVVVAVRLSLFLVLLREEVAPRSAGQCPPAACRHLCPYTRDHPRDHS